MTVRTALAGAALAAILAAAPSRADTPAANPDQPHESSLAAYRKHLQALTAIVQACAKARDSKTCDPELVGSDDHVPVAGTPNAESRLVRYGWLRALLSDAQEKDTEESAPKPAPGAKPVPPEDATLPPPRTVAQLLQDAQARLGRDLGQSYAAPALSHSQERGTMNKVLAGKEFRDLEKPTAQDSMLEELSEWMNVLRAGASRWGAGAAWVGRLIVWGFILAVCVGLVWGLLQLERRWRLRLVPQDGAPAAGAASARNWQLWLQDARAAAAQGRWREAVHFVYWATISRLESRRLWPADRARTPREYLALVAAEDPRKPNLTTLTASFERIWYGGRNAGENDYQNAEQLAAALISGSGTTGGSAL